MKYKLIIYKSKYHITKEEHNKYYFLSGSTKSIKTLINTIIGYTKYNHIDCHWLDAEIFRNRDFNPQNSAILIQANSVDNLISILTNSPELLI